MIGLFDSGSGGLTVLSALRKQAPHADVLYFGDIANAPYGEKTEAELTQLTQAGVHILEERGATALISACNSVSTSVLAGAAGNLPFVEMSLPTARYMEQFSGKRFLLIATPATVLSGLYEKSLKGVVALDSLPIPDLAGAIEFEHSEDKIREILEKAFAPRLGEKYDGLILGCTHYPLIRSHIETIARKFFGDLMVIDPAYAVADEAARRFGDVGTGSTTFLLSQKSDAFERRVRNLFPNIRYSIELT